jgi:hypothetical protein
VTSSEVDPQPESPKKQDEATRKPDPWGVKRAENLLTSLQGVLSARVIVSPVGEITEVHVLMNSAASPKQMVRNVESALLAHLGLKVDHRKISIAQTAEVRPIEALEQESIRAEAVRRPVIFKGLEVTPSGMQRVTMSVTLEFEGDEVTGEDEVADTAKARVSGAARATAAALDRVLPAGTLELEGIKQVEAFDTQLMCAGVHVVEQRESPFLVGTAEIRESAERAAALAWWDATNRWVQSRT